MTFSEVEFAGDGRGIDAQALGIDIGGGAIIYLTNQGVKLRMVRVTGQRKMTGYVCPFMGVYDDPRWRLSDEQG
jgi:hypothetical protein